MVDHVFNDQQPCHNIYIEEWMHKNTHIRASSLRRRGGFKEAF